MTVSENAPWVGEARARAACADSGVVGLQVLVPPGAWVTLQDGEKVPLGRNQSGSAHGQKRTEAREQRSPD